MSRNNRGFLWWCFVVVSCFGVLAGIAFRFYEITRHDFYFFDEGLFLGYGNVLAHAMKSLPQGAAGFWGALASWVELGIRTDRPLWQMMMDVRVLWGGLEFWSYSRVVSAVAGTLTIALVFMFARKLFQSRSVGLLSAVFLSFLPAHIFYSRLGLAEAATTLFFMAGFYFYFLHRALRTRVVIGSLFFLAAAFCNYRLLIIPLITLGAECFLGFAENRRPDFRQWGQHAAVFAGGIGAVSLLYNGAYFHVTSNWVMHQAHLAKANFDWLNLLSYPYQLFRLASPLWAILFLGNIYFVVNKQWHRLLPFFVVCVQMAIFTFSADKAPRYISAVMPFMAMACAVLVVTLVREQKNMFLKVVVAAGVLGMMASFLVKDVAIVTNHSGYGTAMDYMKSLTPEVHVVATQPMVLNLYAKEGDRVAPCPSGQDDSVLLLPEAGYRHLMLGPQAYVSWTEDGTSFRGKLGGFVGFFSHEVQPVRTFPHLNRVMLERFVFEHNQNLREAVAFLNDANDYMGDIRVYDLAAGIEVIKSRLKARSQAGF